MIVGKERLNQRILQDRVPDVIYVYTYKVRILTRLQNICIYVFVDGSRNAGIVFYTITIQIFFRTNVGKE